MEVAILKRSKWSSVAEKLQTIGTQTYLQWGIVVTLLAVVALFVEFRVSTQAELRSLNRTQEHQGQQIETIKENYPTKEWMEIKLENIRLEIKQSQTKGK